MFVQTAAISPSSKATDEAISTPGNDVAGMVCRRRALALTASVFVTAPLAASAAARESAGRVEVAVNAFAKLPVTKSCLVVAQHPAHPWRVAHDPAARLFVGSAVKTFILAQYLRGVESGRLTENQQIAINDQVRSLSSPVFLKLSGTTAARNVLEAMIAHSDNTATDAALAVVGAPQVRALIAEAGLKATQIPDSTRRLFSYLAGAPEDVDIGWAGVQRAAVGRLPGPPRAPLNDHVTMASTAEDMVRWYQQSLRGAYFTKPDTLREFKRIQSMADALWYVVPADTIAFGKGGSIDWQNFHCFSLPGQMIVGDVPITFCFTINWTGPDKGVAAIFDSYKTIIANILHEASQASR
jgi:beta-lactamase class A